MPDKTISIGNHIIHNGVFLAPMEGITDLPFRIISRRLGADIVYSEFIASDALVRNVTKSFDKMKIVEEERPVAVQIFGSNKESMTDSAKIVEDSGADILDINYGCWVKKVVNGNAGAAFLKDPEKMAEMTAAVVDAVNIPVTIKTRLGWDKSSIVIDKAAKMLEQTGIKAISLHCRTRDQGMRGSADWSWYPTVKKNLTIPLILNGDIVNPEDALRAFVKYDADAIMIGRAAVGYPFLFRQIKTYINSGELLPPPSVKERIDYCLEHLRLSVEYKGFPRGLYQFRKHYSGYLKGLHMASKVRQKLVVMENYEEIKKELNDYYKFLEKENFLDPEQKPPFVNHKLVCRNDSYNPIYLLNKKEEN